MSSIQIFETFVASALVAYLLTPLVRVIAVRTGYFDRPASHKVHAHPTPLLGGASILVAFLIGILSSPPMLEYPCVKAIIGGSAILFVIGLIDDRMGMMPRVKLLGQFLAAMVVIKAGARVTFIPNYYLCVIFTYFWIIGITNAFNLLDNMNGLSSGIASIAGAAFGVIAWINGQAAISALSFILAGACLGFLKHNFPKANIFMGDSGSLIIGYILSCIAIMGEWKTYVWTTSLMIPLLVLGYPVFDTTLVTVMRIKERRSIFDGGRDHSSHRLALLGLKKKRAVYVIFAICLLLGASAVFLTTLRPAPGALLGVSVGIAMLALGVRLGFVKTSRHGRKKVKDEILD